MLNFREFPEHTSAAYISAYYYGADFVELDLQITKDLHLITSHDPCLRPTTNIDSFEWLFGDRKNSFTFYPYTDVFYDDYLINDFDLSEIKMLSRKMR